MATSVKLDDDTLNRVRRLADSKQRSPHWLMCQAIKEFVNREESRESFRKEALASWQAYQENGRHLTADEVADWLDSWGEQSAEENSRRKAPECHE